MALRGKNGTLCHGSTVVSPNITFHYHLGPFTFVPPGRGVPGGLCRLCVAHNKSRSSWATVCKRFALRYRTVVCMSCLSVTLVYCGQTVGWIKMKLGVEVGLGLRPHFVRWGPSIPSPKGAQPPIFGPCLSWPNGWMDQDATWYGGRPWPKPHYVRWGPSSLPKKERSSPLFGRCLLWPYGRPSHLFNRGYRPTTRMRKVSSFSAELNHLNTLSNIKRAFAYL